MLPLISDQPPHDVRAFLLPSSPPPRPKLLHRPLRSLTPAFLLISLSLLSLCLMIFVMFFFNFYFFVYLF
ncbi:putative basic proline-rich protein-like [Iris pallida]|uniref:Basic proline-rich protein-like n=1 Tax=Iris pallida TaxID=29817 RepID=A0AAX6HGD8_IRIPA|nr:putative basic proline-rich protein-like [Iris pallida]